MESGLLIISLGDALGGEIEEIQAKFIFQELHKLKAAQRSGEGWR